MRRLGGSAIAFASVFLVVTPGVVARSHTPSPKAGSRVVAGRSAGKVTVKPRGAHKFRKLGKAVELKVGSTIDATRGTVKVTGRVGTRKISARFSGAAFKLTQSKKTSPLTATLTGAGITCKGRYGKAGARRSLRARGPAGIVVKGCFASSKVKGAKGAVAAAAASGDWTTADTPGVTKVVNAARSVALDLTDATGKTSTLAAGKSATSGPSGLMSGPGGGGPGTGVTLPSVSDFAVFGLYDVAMDDVTVGPTALHLSESHFTLGLHATDTQHPADGSSVVYPASNDIYFPNAKVLCWYDDGHGAYQFHTRTIELFDASTNLAGAGFAGTAQQVHGTETVTQSIEGGFSGPAATPSVHGSLTVHIFTSNVTHGLEGGGTTTDNEICDSTRNLRFEGFR